VTSPHGSIAIGGAHSSSGGGLLGALGSRGGGRDRSSHD
jgi:hypothetical protein